MRDRDAIYGSQFAPATRDTEIAGRILLYVHVTVGDSPMALEALGVDQFALEKIDAESPRGELPRSRGRIPDQ